MQRSKPSVDDVTLLLSLQGQDKLTLDEDGSSSGFIVEDSPFAPPPPPPPARAVSAAAAPPPNITVATGPNPAKPEARRKGKIQSPETISELLMVAEQQLPVITTIGAASQGVTKKNSSTTAMRRKLLNNSNRVLNGASKPAGAGGESAAGTRVSRTARSLLKFCKTHGDPDKPVTRPGSRGRCPDFEKNSKVGCNIYIFCATCRKYQPKSQYYSRHNPCDLPRPSKEEEDAGRTTPESEGSAASELPGDQEST